MTQDDNLYHCLRCNGVNLVVVGESWQYSELPNTTSYWYFDARCEDCGFISRHPRAIPLRPSLWDDRDVFTDEYIAKLMDWT